ncbi:MAG: tetratricopeptide repeat protein [Armatimonadota bacterium]
MQRLVCVVILFLGFTSGVMAATSKEPVIPPPPGIKQVHEFRLEGPMLDRMRENRPGLADVRYVLIRRYQLSDDLRPDSSASTTRDHYEREMKQQGWYPLTDDSYGVRRGGAYSSQDGQWLFAFNIDPRGLVTTLVGGQINLYQIPELERAMLKFLIRGRPFASQEEAEQIRSAHRLEKQGKLDEAISALERGVADHPESSALHQALGELYERAGRQTDLVAQFKAIVALDPSAYLPRLQYGKALYEARKYAEALFELQQASTLAPDKGTPYYYIGRVQEDQAHLNDALVAYEMAMERGREWLSVPIRMALIHEQMQDWAAAAEDYRKALQIKPGYRPAKEGLARVNAKLTPRNR